jgi:hypothetical protein
VQLTYRACARSALIQRFPRGEKNSGRDARKSRKKVRIRRTLNFCFISFYLCISTVHGVVRPPVDTLTEVCDARKFDPDIFEGGLSSVVVCTCTEQSFHWGTVDLAIAMSSDKRLLNNSPNGQSHMWGCKPSPPSNLGVLRGIISVSHTYCTQRQQEYMLLHTTFFNVPKLKAINHLLQESNSSPSFESHPLPRLHPVAKN